MKSSAAARFFSTYSAPSVALRCSSPFRNRSSSNALMMLSFQPDRDILGLQVVPKRLTALFAAIAGFAVATKGRFNAACVPFVDKDLTGAQMPRGAGCAIQIGGEDTRHQPVIGAIGNLDGLCVVAEGQHRQDRAKDLLLRDVHIERHV